MQDPIIGKTVLITGASSGIGASFARFLAGRDLRVILTARREERLAALASEIESQGGEAHFYPCDLGDASARQSLFNSIQSEIGQVDILINNAGFGWYGYYYQMAWDDAAQMAAVNIEALAHLTRLFLPNMVVRKQGHIVNIGSIAGALPNQGIAMYSASKAFVDAFTSSLYRELRGSGVSASVMRLGPVETEFYDQAKKKKNGSAVPAESLAISVERVNKALWRLLKHPRRLLFVPGWLRITSLVEPLFGGLIDLLGPLLLHRKDD